MAVNNNVIYPLFGKRGHPHKTSHRKHQKRQWNRNPSSMDAESQNIEQQERLATADCWGNISSKCANRNFWIPASVSISPVIPPPPPAHRQYTHPPPVFREIFIEVHRYFSYTPQRREAPGNEDEPVIIAEARTGTTRPGVHHAILQL